MLTSHIAQKKSVEAQLSEDKADMQEERSELLRSGASPRQAQMEATAGTDFEWRSKAKAKLRHLDSEIPKLRQRLHLIGEATQRTVVLRGSADDVSLQINAMIADGNYILQAVPFGGSVILLYKGMV